MNNNTITLEQAKALTSGTILYHINHRNSDGSPERWRVNGKVKTWKREPNRVQVPIKYGLRTCDYLTETSLHYLCLTAETALHIGNPTRKW
jgi:hypothetical protein